MIRSRCGAAVDGDRRTPLQAARWPPATDPPAYHGLVVVNQRPRDELGRPLPWGSESRLVLLDYDAMSIEEDHRLGLEYLAARQFFSAHEAWEGAWRKAKGGPDEEFFKGLSQLGAGYTHYLRGNAHGARTLLRRGLGRIRPYGSRHHGLEVGRLVRSAQRAATALAGAKRGQTLPKIAFPRAS